MIIGLTGTMGAGKSEVARYLKSKGFEYFVYSDILREIAKTRNIQPTRENLQRLGSEIKRRTNDLGILSKKIIERMKKDKAVVDGIRTVDEVKELRKRKDFYLIGINAPQRVRYMRIRKRNREGDPKTFGEFKKLDNMENRGKTEGQEINKCLRMADYIIFNNKSIEDLKKEIDKILESIS